jgi:thiamine transport system permease protein
MFKDLKRFKSSTLLGGTLSFALLSFSFLLFYTLYTTQETDLFSQIDNRIFDLLKFTIYQAFLSTILSLFVGLLLAWALSHQTRFKGRSLLVALFSSSLVLPTLIVVFGIIGIFGRQGYLNQISLYLFDTSFGTYLYGLSGILVAHVYLNASFALRALLHSFESIPKEKYKLAKSLNFSVFKRFWYVEYPALKTTLLSIGSTIFLLCFTSFAVVLLLGGNPSYNTLEVAIYEAVKLDFDIAMALKLALIQLSISSVLIVLSSNFKINVNNIATSNTFIPWKDSKIIQMIQYSIIGLFALFFISPLFVIFLDGINANFIHIFSDPIFIKSLYTSLVLAFISSLLTVIVAILLSNTRRNFSLETRLASKPFSKILNAFVAFSGNLYLAIPSLVMGLGFFLMYQKYDGSFIIWSSLALLTANVLMSLPFALAVLVPVMNKTAKRYDKLSFSLGLSTFQRYKDIEYPYLKSSLAYVFALSFCFSLGDLGIIALFGSDEFITLPWYLYQLMGSYRTTDAAGVALILLVLVLCVFILIPRLFRSKIA